MHQSFPRRQLYIARGAEIKIAQVRNHVRRAIL
jgi:hypothetical protein